MLNPTNVIAAAQKLMTNGDFWNRVDEADRRNAAGMGGRGNQVSKESLAYNSGKQYNLISEQQIMSSQMNSGNHIVPGSNLPEALRESFKNLPPIQYDSSVMAQIPDSFFSGASANMQKEIQREQRSQSPTRPQQAQQRQQINEQTYQPQSISQTIDYNYIKFLIQETIKEELKNTQLNESSNGSIVGMKLVNGGTFQFMDSKGHLYEAKLKRIK